METAEQWEFLKEIDCEMSQGFYFFRPTSLADSVNKIHRTGPTYNFEDRAERENTEIQWLLKETEEK